MQTTLRTAPAGAVLFATIVLCGARADAVNVCTAAELIAAENSVNCPVDNGTHQPCLIHKTTHNVVSANCTFDFTNRDFSIDGTIDINNSDVTFIAKNFTILPGGFLDARQISSGNTVAGNVTIQASGAFDIQKTAAGTGRIQALGNTAGGKIIITAAGGSITVSGTLDASGNSSTAQSGAIALTASTSITINSGAAVNVTGENSSFVPPLPELALTANGGGVTINQSLFLDGGGNSEGLVVSATGNVSVAATVSIDVGANSATITCNNFTLSSTMASGAYIDARGINAAPGDLGGVVTISASGSVDIQRVGSNAAIDAGGNTAGGRIAIVAGTSVNVAGRLNIDGLGSESDAGIITVDAGTTITTGANSTISGSAPFGHSGGDMTFTAVGDISLGTPIINLDGGDGGSLSITSTNGQVTMVGMTAKGNGTGFVQDLGSGGFLDMFAGLGLTINGAITANGTHDGCGGCIQGFADFGNIAINGSINTNSVSPYEGGAGGQMCFQGPGTVTVANGASLTAFGDGGYGCGGTIDLDGSLGVTVGGALDARGGSGGGFICVFSDANISVTNNISLGGIAAAGVGGDLTIQAGIMGPGNLTVSNNSVMDVTGGPCTMIEGCGTGGSVSLEACGVIMQSGTKINASAPSGTGNVTIVGHESLNIAANINALHTTDPFGDDGSITFEYRTGATVSFTPANNQPAATLDPRSTCTAMSVPDMSCLTACPTCGNGIVEYPETCDPTVQSPPLNCDGCTRFCRDEDCTDNNVCTTDACDPTLGCHHILNPPCATDTPTLTPTGGTLTPTETKTPSKTRTFTPTQTPTISATFTITRTPTISPTVTITRTFTRTPTVTPSGSVTRTPTISPTGSVTRTPTISATFTPSRTPTISATFTVTQTPTLSPNFSPTRTPTITQTLTPSITLSPTVSPTPLPTLQISNGVGRPGGAICLAAKLNNAGTPQTFSNDIRSFAGIPVTFSSVTINPAIGAGTTPNKTVGQMSNAGTDTYTVGPMNGNGIPNGDLYTATYTTDAMAALGTYPLSQPPGAAIIISNCTGDCDGNGTVSLAEVQTCINKFLSAPICNPANSAANCPVADIDGNNALSIGELQQCVLRFLSGCPPAP